MIRASNRMHYNFSFRCSLTLKNHRNQTIKFRDDGSHITRANQRAKEKKQEKPMEARKQQKYQKYNEIKSKSKSKTTNEEMYLALFPLVRFTQCTAFIRKQSKWNILIWPDVGNQSQSCSRKNKNKIQSRADITCFECNGNVPLFLFFRFCSSFG